MSFSLRLSAALAFSLVAVAAPAQTNDPAAHIAAYNDGIVAIMKQRLSFPARADRFETLVRTYYDMPAITAVVIGPGWAKASAAERNAAIAALTRHSANSLARNFVKFGGERFTLDPNVTSRGASRIVRVTIAAPNSNGDTLYYRLRQSGSGWKILDVISGGVSQLALQRADLASTIATGGIAGLTRRLQQLDAAAPQR